MSMPMPGMDNNGTGASQMNMQMMQMSFYWGTNVVVLFNEWPGYSYPAHTAHHEVMYILALLMVFFFAFGVEILSMSPRLRPKALNPLAKSFIYAMVFGIRMALAYLVMLSVMSFNTGVFIVAVVGHVAGTFVVKYRAFTELDREADLRP